MPYLSRESKRRILLFLLFTLLAVVLNQFAIYFLYSPSTFLYCGILIAWALTIYRRIVERHVRVLLVAGAVFLLSLFVLRLCRWTLFAWSLTADRIL